MKELVSSVVLLDRVTSAFEHAEVFRDLDQKNLDDFERLWRPMLKSRRDEFPSWGASAAANAQDSHWDWVEKAEATTRSLQYETFALECSGETQGLMLVDITKFGRVDGQRGRELVYIEFLATAPWNRPGFVPTPRYKGVGRVLLGTAISLSIELWSSTDGSACTLFPSRKAGTGPRPASPMVDTITRRRCNISK